MSIPVISIIRPLGAATGVAGTHPVAQDIDLLGGLQTVLDHTARNAIPNTNRKQGMLVFTISDTSYWELNAPPWTGVDGDWTAATFGGGTTIPVAAASSIVTPVGGKTAFYNTSNNDAFSTKDTLGNVQAYQTQIVINVLDYPWSFDNTGATANDTNIAALSAYVAGLTNPAATIYFPNGKYLFHNSVARFPSGCNFKGDSKMYTQIMCDGPGDGYGVFWYADNNLFTDLYFISKYSANPYVLNPAQDAVITNATNTSPITITTAVAHNYLTGDKIGIYGVKGNTAANCDPAIPWTITVQDATNFALNGSTGNGAYTSSTINISNVSTAAYGLSTVNQITTSTPHGLFGGQLMYIAGVTGTGGLPANVNGAERMVLPVDATNFKIARNIGNNVQPFVGGYTTGGTVFTGGVCLSYSRNPQVAISVGQFGDVGNRGNVTFLRCLFDGFKYGISLDGAESCHIEDCKFGLQNFGYGYNGDISTDDSTHTSAGIRIGAFQTYNGLGLLNANFNFVTHCNFYAHHVGIYHHDGVNHVVSQSNYEQSVVALIDASCYNITYLQCENDGSNNDTRGIIQVRRDIIGGSPSYSLAIKDCSFSANSSCAMIYGDASVFCFGIEVTNCLWLTTGSVHGNLILSQASFGEPFTVRQNDLQGSPTLSDGLGGLPNSISGLSVFNSGTTINHYNNGAAALDIGFYPYAGIAPANSPAFLIRQPNEAQPNFSSKEWTTTTAYWGGSFQEYDNVISANTGNTSGARHTVSLGWVSVNGGVVDGYNIGNLAIPDVVGSGTITAIVQAERSSLESANAFWKIKQRYYQFSGSITLGSVDEIESYDGIGLTIPIIVLTGAFGSTIAQCTVYSNITGGLTTTYSVKLELDHLGA